VHRRTGFFGSATAVAVGLALATHLALGPTPHAPTASAAEPRSEVSASPRPTVPATLAPSASPELPRTTASPSPTEGVTLPRALHTPAAVRAVVPRPPAGSKILYLSFDDGPNPTWTPRVLSLLAQYNAHATFFMIGKMAAQDPALIAQVKAAGNTVGNHTWSHPDLLTLTNAQVRAEVVKAASVLGSTTCTRAPYGGVNPRVADDLAELGQRSQLWDIDPRDWSRPGSAAIVRTIEKHAYSGGVILLHDGGGDRSQTLAALKVILNGFTARGWTFEVIPGC
jgi:peptidoglycan/xylan/chitin deacetylase (PgdA/CDA1 family)